VDEDVLLLGLDQVVALLTDVPQEAVHVDALPLTHLPQHGIQNDVGARPSYTSAARIHSGHKVNDHGACSGRVGSRRLGYEAKDWQRMVWYPMVWPVGVVILVHHGNYLCLLHAQTCHTHLLHFDVLDGKRANGVCCHDNLLNQLNLNDAIGLSTFLWPIHVAFTLKDTH
ncbi:unnamed protein product, partial [Ixodes pacificus]